MTILDRMILIAFVKAFLICLLSLLSLYIVIDLFTHLDDYGAKGEGFFAVVLAISEYYLYHIPQYYDRLSEAMGLMAAMFTVAWMQRNNEILPILSAGVSTRRILRPVLAGVALVLTLGMLNQELLIPRIADVLLQDRNDPQNEREKLVQGSFDTTGIHIEGHSANLREQTVKMLHVSIPESRSTSMAHLTARVAHYVPPSSEPLSGGWLLTETTPETLAPTQKPEGVVQLDAGRYFVYTKDITLQSITRDPKWFNYASILHLHRLLNRSDAIRQPQIAVIYHIKITRPLVGLLLVAMGLGTILRDQNRHVFISAGMCLGMCALFYAVLFTCRFLGNGDYLPPALAAWMPLLIFGPVTLVLYDAIHT